jgi:hypothetical protein
MGFAEIVSARAKDIALPARVPLNWDSAFDIQAEDRSRCLRFDPCL